MKIRVSRFFFIANIVVLSLMLVGPILAFCLIDFNQNSFFLFIPIVMLVSLFTLNFLVYYLSPFEVNEEGFYKYFFGKKKINIKKDAITNIDAIYNDPDTKNSVSLIVILYKNNIGKLFQTELSGNLYNLKQLIEAFKKYGYPVEER